MIDLSALPSLLPLAREGGSTKAASPLIRPRLMRGPPSPASGRRKGGGLTVFVLAILLAGVGMAAAGDIAVTAPWLRATPKNASVAGGYADITNKGTQPDRLLGASLPMAPDGQVHSMSMQGGVMHMERLAKGLAIAPGATVRLTPGGYHLMFEKPKRQLKEGETVQGTLVFQKAGKVAVTFPVAGFGAKEAPKPAPK